VKDFSNQLFKFNINHLWIIENERLKFITEIGEENILLVEKIYSKFKYISVFEVCYITDDDN